MKKICLMICCILILQMLNGCGGKTEEFKEPVNFYYSNKEISYNSPDGVIQSEQREGAGYHGNLTAFMHAYLRGPVSAELETVIPSDVYLVSCEIIGDTANITLSSQFAKLSGVKLATACSSILLSVHDYTGVEAVCIRAKDAKLDDKDDLVLTMNDIVLIDTATIVD